MAARVMSRVKSVRLLRREVGRRRPDLKDFFRPELDALEILGGLLDGWQAERIADEVRGFPTMLREFQTGVRSVADRMMTIPRPIGEGRNWADIVSDGTGQ